MIRQKSLKRRPSHTCAMTVVPSSKALCTANMYVCGGWSSEDETQSHKGSSWNMCCVARSSKASERFTEEHNGHTLAMSQLHNSKKLNSTFQFLSCNMVANTINDIFGVGCACWEANLNLLLSLFFSSSYLNSHIQYNSEMIYHITAKYLMVSNGTCWLLPESVPTGDLYWLV